MGRTTCSKCGSPLDGAHKSYCKSCMAAYNREARAKNPEAHKATQRRHHERHPGKRAEYKRRYYLKSEYNLTEQQFEEMYDERNGCCDICSKPIAGKNCHVDHCHETGQVRGLLCSNCNTGLGMFKDSDGLLVAAAMYLINSTLLDSRR